ncbi:ATP-binding protein [Burkholderia pyrrocinia]
MHENSIDTELEQRDRSSQSAFQFHIESYRTECTLAYGGVLNAAFLLLLLFYANHLLSRPGTCTSLNQTLSAVVWPAPVLGIALLLHCERPVIWWLGAASLFVTMMVAGSLDWVPWHIDALFTTVNVAEAVVGAWLGRRYVTLGGGKDTMRGFGIFLLLLPVGMSAMHATFAAAILSVWMSDRNWLNEWSRAYVANALALLTLLPALLTWNVQAFRASWSCQRRWLAAFSVAGSLCFALVWSNQGEIARAILALALCWAALEGSLAFVSQLNAGVVVSLVGMTLSGLGPYAMRHNGHGVWALQVDLIGVAILSMCIAIVTGERHRLARQVERSRRFESLGFFACGIVHDFNNVLTTIACYAEYADDQLSTGQRCDESIREVRRATERGRELTKQILLAARLGESHLTSVRLGEVVTEAVDSVKVVARRNVEIVWRGDISQRIVVADRSQLVRAVLNLVSNAIRVAHTKVEIRIGAGDKSLAKAFDLVIGEPVMTDSVWIEVIDDGNGIDVEPLDRIFEPFFSKRPGPTGAGLGLAIVAGTAVAHHGQVAVATYSGVGSRFRLTLPVKRNTSEPGDLDMHGTGQEMER